MDKWITHPLSTVVHIAGGTGQPGHQTGETIRKRQNGTPRAYRLPLSWLAEVDYMPQAVTPDQASKGRDNERKQTHRDDSHTLLQRGGVAADAVRPAHHAL